MSAVLVDHPIYRRGEATASGCLIWTGAVKSNGYGHVNREGRTVMVHRLSWELANGRAVPSGQRVLHRCDNRRCFHPAHLHLGTARHNSREMVLRGRYRGPAKLSPTQRAEVVAAVGNGDSQRAVAARFGVSQGTVSNIVRGKHTALGDARWARAIYDSVTGGEA